MSHLGYLNAMATARAKVRWEARHPSECGECGERINVGDILRWEGDVAVHAECAPDDAPTTEVCGVCCMAVAVNGACGCDE